MKRAAAGLGAVLLVVALGGCRSQRDTYCEAIRADQVKLGEMVNSERIDSLIRGLPLLRSLAAQAPDDLTDEWQTFVNAVAGLADAVRAAGLSAQDLADGLPASLSTARRNDIKAAATRLASPDVVSAADGIETEARDVCKVDIGV